MRRWLPLGLTLVILLALSPPVRAQAAVFNVDSNQGSVQVILEELRPVGLKVLVEKDNTRYFYNLNRRQERFPLQMGAGKYRVHVLEHTEGNKYKFVQSEEFDLLSAVLENSFLGSIQNIPWEEAPQVVAKARELTQQTNLAGEKLKEIYSFVIDNVRYDHKKAERLPTEYLPNPEETLLTGQGICYDYASLFASMLRSVGVPTKLVMGTAEGVPDYHAWNEVYVDGEWLIIDTTVDAKLKQVDKPFSMVKGEKAYRATRVY